MSHDTLELLRELRPAEAAATRELFTQAERDELLATIVCAKLQAPSAARVRRRDGSVRRLRPAFVPALGAAGVAGATAVVLVLALTGSAVRPTTARAVVAFRAAADGDIVATVVDPFAAQTQLDDAFRAHGFDITVTLLPVSPSLVGTVLYIGDDGDGITALQGGSCVTGGGGCPIGVRIAADFSGQGAIALGRPAQAGEAYESSASVFAPGEPLHCSGLLGAQVSVAEPQLAADGYTVQWRENDATATATEVQAAPPPDNYVWDADATAAGSLIVWTDPQPWPDDPTHGSAVNTGCSMSRR